MTAAGLEPIAAFAGSRRCPPRVCRTEQDRPAGVPKRFVVNGNAARMGAPGFLTGAPTSPSARMPVKGWWSSLPETLSRRSDCSTRPGSGNAVRARDVGSAKRAVQNGRAMDQKKLCRRCGTEMEVVAEIRPFGEGPGLVAFFCRDCRATESILVDMESGAQPRDNERARETWGTSARIPGGAQHSCKRRGDVRWGSLATWFDPVLPECHARSALGFSPDAARRAHRVAREVQLGVPGRNANEVAAGS